MLTQINKIYMEKSKDLGNDQWKINFMNELIDVVHQIAESGLRPKWLIFLIGIYFVIFVFVFFFNQKFIAVCTFFILCYVHA